MAGATWSLGPPPSPSVLDPLLLPHLRISEPAISQHAPPSKKTSVRSSPLIVTANAHAHALSTNPPAKQANSHIQLSPTDLDSIINSVISPSVPSTPKSSPNKRKNTVVVSDGESSDVEIIEGPHPSPKKKTKPSSPRPGTAAFGDLPGLSIPDVIQEATRPSADVFGTTGRPSRSKVKTEKGVFLEELKASRKTRNKSTVGETESPVLATETLPTPKKPATKDTTLGSPMQLTEPATPSKGAKNGAVSSKPKSSKANNRDADMSSPVVKDLRRGRVAKGKVMLDDNLDKNSSQVHEAPNKAADNFKIASDERDLRAPDISPCVQDVQANASELQEFSDDDLPEVAELMLSTPKKKVQSVTDTKAEKKQRSLLASIVDNEAVESDGGSGKSEQGSDRYLATDDDGSVGYHSEDDAASEQSSDHEGAPHSENTDNIATVGAGDQALAAVDPTVVMSITYQDPRLVQFYQNLPHLDTFKPIEPFSQNATATSARFEFSKIAPSLNASETQALLKALLFTQSGFFVNFSRIHPKFLQHDNKYIRMARTDNAIAVGLFTGLCTKGMIFNVDQIGRPQSPNHVHGVSVAGSDQETRRYMSLINTVLGRDKITGNASRFGMSFYTRGQGKDGNFGPAAAAQTMIEDDEFSPLLSSVAMPGSSTTTRGFPSSRSFDERIPVYDGRAKSGRLFTFSDEDFQGLSSWPRFKGEIQRHTIISVGHTVGIYEGVQLYLSTNIHFVIVLGKPAVGL